MVFSYEGMEESHEKDSHPTCQKDWQKELAKS